MIKLRKQNLIVCPNKKASNPPQDCVPYNCFKKLNHQSYELFDLDGYTVNFLRKVASALFVKREYSFDELAEANEDTIIQSILNNENNNEWFNRLLFSEKLNISLFLTVWPYDYPNKSYDGLENPVMIFKAERCGNNIQFKLVEKGNKDNLQQFINRYRGFSFKYVKPLIISKTYMECYLSATPDPWPGDLDGVIKHSESDEIKALLEFKTHNLQTSIEDEGVNKYQSQDLRRFKALFYLQNQIKQIQGKEPPILFIIWSTREEHKRVKLQILNNGEITEELLIESTANENYQNLYKKIVEMF